MKLSHQVSLIYEDAEYERLRMRAIISVNNVSYISATTE
jgi:hypothetical protein